MQKLVYVLFGIIMWQQVVLAAKSSFYDIYKKHSTKQIYQDLFSRYQIKYRQKYLDKSEFKYLPDGYMQLFPVGPLQLWAVAMPGKKFLVVYDIEEGGLAEKYKLQRFDEIHGVNGKLFSEKHKSSKGIGADGPVKQLGEAIDYSQAKGKLMLSIKRGKQLKKFILPIDKIGRFSVNYPSKCRKSALYLGEILERIDANGKKRRFSSPCSEPLLGLALLSAGKAKYLDGIFGYVERTLPKKDLLHWNKSMRISKSKPKNSWLSGFSLIFLCEYFWATGDEKVFPVIQQMANNAATVLANPFGGYGHGSGGLGTYGDISFGAPGPLNIIGLALAEKVGCKVDRMAYQRYYRMATNTVHEQIKGNSGRFEIDKNSYYSIGYRARVQKSDKPGITRGPLNTAATALALHLAPQIQDSKKLAVKLAHNLSLNPHSFSYIHSTPSLGLFWATLTQSAMDREGLRKSLDYRKYWLTQSRGGHGEWFYFYPKLASMGHVGGGWKGDEYLKLEACQLYQAAALLTSNRRRLLLQGNRKRNWLNPSRNPKETMAFISEYHRYYVDELLSQATKHEKAGEYVEAAMIVQRLISQYSGKSTVGKIRKYYAGLQKRVGVKKLANSLTMAKGQHYLDYIEGHQRINGSFRKDLLNYVARLFNGTPVEVKAKSLALIDKDPAKEFFNRKKAKREKKQKDAQ